MYNSENLFVHEMSQDAKLDGVNVHVHVHYIYMYICTYSSYPKLGKYMYMYNVFVTKVHVNVHVQ